MVSRPSTISRLPENIREKIVLLRDQGRTLDEIMAALDALDVNISRSSLGRYVKKHEVVAENLRKSRALAEAVGRSFGDAETSKVARTNIELLHSLMMKMMVGEDDDAVVSLDAKEAMFLATAIEKATKASKADLETQLKARLEQERRQTLEQAATVAADTAKKQGLSKETVDAIKKNILGIT